MAKHPTTKKAPATPAAPGASKPPRTSPPKASVLQRIPQDILDALDARATREGMSRNHAFILAALEWGDFTPAQRKAILARLDAEPVSVASKVNTAIPDAIKAGARLDKKAIGKRLEPKPKPGKKGKPPAAAEDEVIL